MYQLKDIGHDVAGRTLFQKISISILNKKYGMVGPNGVGKSTLAKILAGMIEPSMGIVQATGEVLYFSQSEFRPERTVADFMMDVWSNSSGDAQTIDLLTRELVFEKNIRDLSGGEWMRLRLARAVSTAPSLLVLDEPTNDLDRQARELVVAFVRASRQPLLIISHDRELLLEVDEILELSNQGLSVYPGNYDSYFASRTREREKLFEQANQAKRNSHKKERERSEKLQAQEKRMRQGAKSAPDSGLPRILLGKRKRQAQTTHAKLDVRENHSVTAAQMAVTEAVQELKVDPFLRLDFEGAAVPAQKIVLHLEDLNFRFDARQGWLWKEAVNLTIRGPQRLHIRGANGAGKSTLLSLILRESALSDISVFDRSLGGEQKGHVHLSNRNTVFLDQGCSSLKPENSILEELIGHSRFDITELRNELAFYGFKGEAVHQKIATLSGGEKIKASLAKAFLGRILPDLVILDEPTNNLDFGSIETLERALLGYQGALIVVSHDAAFVERILITTTLDLR